MADATDDLPKYIGAGKMPPIKEGRCDNTGNLLAKQ
jgi:hypothetical protein